MSVINTNTSATSASYNLAASNAMLQKSLNRLSSGSKIVNPSDDAGGLAVSLSLSSAARRSGATANNIGNAVSFLQTQDGALKVSGKILERISELKVLNSDVTKSTSDKANYDKEFQALQAQLTETAKQEFNGVSLFGSANLTVGTTETNTGVSGSAGTVNIVARELNKTGSAVKTVTSEASSTGKTALDNITQAEIKAAITEVATMRADNGSEQSRFGFAAELVTINKANIEAANSRIVDVDVAEESTQLARWNILTQAGTSMLAQANQSAQSTLRLIQ